MSGSIRVVVENGRLRPLDPVDLVEGQEIEVILVAETGQSTPALDGQLALFPSGEDDRPLS